MARSVPHGVGEPRVAVRDVAQAIGPAQSEILGGRESVEDQTIAGVLDDRVEDVAEVFLGCRSLERPAVDGVHPDVTTELLNRRPGVLVADPDIAALLVVWG